MGSAYDMSSQVSWWGQALSIPLIFLEKMRRRNCAYEGRGATRVAAKSKGGGVGRPVEAQMSAI